MKRQKIPAALRQAVWLKHNGPVFYAKCKVSWCNTQISVFNYEAGHDIAHSKGGPANIDNLMPICSSCNRSMGNHYTIQEFSKMYATTDVPVHKNRGFWKQLWFRCFRN